MSDIVILGVESATLDVVSAQIEIVELGVLGSPIEIVELGIPGPRGPQGLAGLAGVMQTIEAATSLSGHRAVTIGGVYADYRSALALHLAGLIVSAALAGDEVAVVQSGFVEWPAAGLIPDLPLFLGVDGMLTQTPPLTGWLRQIAVAVSETTITVDIGPAYFLGD